MAEQQRQQSFTICQRYKSINTTVRVFSCLLFAALLTVAPRLLYPWNFSGKDTEMGCHFLLQVVLPTQGLNSGLLHLLRWLAGPSLLSHLGNKPLHHWLILKCLT